MRKTIGAILLLVIISGVGWWMIADERDATYEQIVEVQVVRHVTKQFGRDDIASVKPYFVSSESSKSRRHQIAVQLKSAPTGEYRMYRVLQNKVEYIGRSRTVRSD
ncbi:hypothetical protein [Exiguobacterium sp. s191]|uniref:hypothetical protein n=1 Tax=Exiguobacterium sp. s191 TaxID=2751196 RepID=UPI001BE53631|nr:hypothetical protein [Exiguobacterium sp. s191]